MNTEEELQGLENLLATGIITEEEYQNRRKKILGLPEKIWGMDESSFLMLMHLSQFTGFVLPLIMWLMNRENPTINRHGENIANFMISMYIYMTISAFLCIVIIGFLMLPALLIIQLIYIIRIAMDAGKNIYKDYPLCIKVFPAR